MYYLSGYVTLTYFSSYVYVVKDWSVSCLAAFSIFSLTLEQLENYTYFNNMFISFRFFVVTVTDRSISLTVGLCTFSVLGGVIQRVTHRYKYLQLAGLGIRIMCAFSVPPPVDRSQILRLSSGQGLVFLAANGNKRSAEVIVQLENMIDLSETAMPS
jgi:hypothetical protein